MQHKCLVAHAPVLLGDGPLITHIGDPHLQKAPAARQKPKRRVDELTCQRLRTTSTPLPSVADRNCVSKLRSRELAICRASSPILSSTGHLPALAVPYTSAPKCLHSCTAAIPTPPAAA